MYRHCSAILSACSLITKSLVRSASCSASRLAPILFGLVCRHRTLTTQRKPRRARRAKRGFAQTQGIIEGHTNLGPPYQRGRSSLFPLIRSRPDKLGSCPALIHRPALGMAAGSSPGAAARGRGVLLQAAPRPLSAGGTRLIRSPPTPFTPSKFAWTRGPWPPPASRLDLRCACSLTCWEHRSGQPRLRAITSVRPETVTTVPPTPVNVSSPEPRWSPPSGLHSHLGGRSPRRLVSR